MIQKTGRVLAVALMILLVVNTAALAGGRNRVGTTSGTQLLIPVGARYVGMAGAGVAIAQGVESIYWNPAGLTAMDNSATAMFSYMPYIADIGVSYGAIGVKMGSLGNIGFSIKALNIGEIDVTTAAQPDGTGETFTPTFFTLGITYAKQLTDQVAVGVNINSVNETFSRAEANGIALDVGIQYDNVGGVEGLKTGIAVKNVGPSMKYGGSGLYHRVDDLESDKTNTMMLVDAAEYELPSIIEMGLAYTYDVGEMGSVTATYQFRNNNFADDESIFGGEFAYKDMAFLRAGYIMAPDKPEDWDYIYGLTFGAGVMLKTGGLDIGLNYAFRQVDLFDNNNVISLTLGF